MTEWPDDPLSVRLARLLGAVPDENHRARVRARCHAALERRRARAAVTKAAARSGWHAELTAAALVAIYVLAVLGDALSAYGLIGTGG
jgi:hypothetical protein